MILCEVVEDHIKSEGYEQETSSPFGSEILEDIESMKRYCLRNDLKPGTDNNMYTGVVGSQRYFIRGEPIPWEAASHIVAGSFMNQYDFKTPEIEYVDDELIISSLGEAPIPVDTKNREFKIRENIPNFLQPARVSQDSVADSLFVHLAGGAHDIEGNTVINGNTAYPIDFQTFGKTPSKSLRKFLNGRENFVEKKFTDYGDRLGFAASEEYLRRRVRDRSVEFDEETFWYTIEKYLEAVDENISKSARRFANNTVEFAEELRKIDFK